MTPDEIKAAIQQRALSPEEFRALADRTIGAFSALGVPLTNATRIAFMLGWDAGHETGIEDATFITHAYLDGDK
jgi:hypothetical protein